MQTQRLDAFGEKKHEKTHPVPHPRRSRERPRGEEHPWPLAKAASSPRRRRGRAATQSPVGDGGGGASSPPARWRWCRPVAPGGDVVLTRGDARASIGGGVVGVLPGSGGPRDAGSHLAWWRRSGLGSVEIWQVVSAGGGGGLIWAAQLLVCARLAIRGCSVAGCRMWLSAGGCCTDGCCTCPGGRRPKAVRVCPGCWFVLLATIPVGGAGWWR